MSDNSPDNRIEKYTKKELATLLNVVEEDMRRQRQQFSQASALKTKKLEEIEESQAKLFNQLQDFVESLTDQMARSNNTIKELSLSMYGIITFYKELIDAAKTLNDQESLNSSSQVFEIINRAQGLVERINFDTEIIDQIVAENDELITKKIQIFEKLRLLDEEEKLIQEERRWKPIPKVDLLLRKSTEMLSISPQSGFIKKTIHMSSQEEVKRDESIISN